MAGGTILVSACLLGRCCKYNGKHNLSPEVIDFIGGREVIEVCPEVLAGLGTPRPPIEIKDGAVIRQDGTSVDAEIRTAVEKILDSIKDKNVELCILKSRSPTCGVKQVYDGSFSSRLIDGQGVLCAALSAAGYRVLDSEELSEEKIGKD
jgi:uncharacterized protein YbbK (DUF523 family)